MINYLNFRFFTLLFISLFLMFLPTSPFFKVLLSKFIDSDWLILSISISFSALALYFFIWLSPKTKTVKEG